MENPLALLEQESLHSLVNYLYGIISEELEAVEGDKSNRVASLDRFRFNPKYILYYDGEPGRAQYREYMKSDFVQLFSKSGYLHLNFFLILIKKQGWKLVSTDLYNFLRGLDRITDLGINHISDAIARRTEDVDIEGQYVLFRRDMKIETTILQKTIASIRYDPEGVHLGPYSLLLSIELVFNVIPEAEYRPPVEGRGGGTKYLEGKERFERDQKK